MGAQRIVEIVEEARDLQALLEDCGSDQQIDEVIGHIKRFIRRASTQKYNSSDKEYLDSFKGTSGIDHDNPEDAPNSMPYMRFDAGASDAVIDNIKADIPTPESVGMEELDFLADRISRAASQKAFSFSAKADKYGDAMLSSWRDTAKRALGFLLRTQTLPKQFPSEKVSETDFYSRLKRALKDALQIAEKYRNAPRRGEPDISPRPKQRPALVGAV